MKRSVVEARDLLLGLALRLHRPLRVSPGTTGASAAAPAGSPSPASRRGARSAPAPPDWADAATNWSTSASTRDAAEIEALPLRQIEQQIDRTVEAVEMQHRRRWHARRGVPVVPQGVAGRADGRQRGVAACPVVRHSVHWRSIGSWPARRATGLAVTGIDGEDELGPVAPQPEKACHGVQSADRNSNTTRAERRSRRSPFASRSRTCRSVCVVPQCVQSHCRAAGAILAQRQDGVRDRDQPVQVERAAARLVPTASRRSWRAAMTSRSSRASARAAGPCPAIGASSRASSWSRSSCHGMPPVPRAAARNRATSPAGPLTVRRLRSQSVWTGANGAPGIQGPPGPWRGSGQRPDLCFLARRAHRSSSRAGLSTTIRARRR